MKLIGLVMLSLILYHPLLSQSCFRLIKPTFALNDTSDLKRLKLLPCINSDQTFSTTTVSRAVRIVDNENRLIASILFSCYFDSVKVFHNDPIKTEMADKNDTFSISNKSIVDFYKIYLIIPESNNHLTLIEDSLIIGKAKQALLFYFPLTTSLHKNDSGEAKAKKRNPFLKVHGNIIVSGQLADGKLYGQGIPEKYLRTQVNCKPELLGVPFNFSYYTTSENNSDFHGINNYRVSFDYATFYNKLKHRLDTLSELDKLKKISRITKLDIEQINKESLKLKAQLNNQSYLKQMMSNKNILNKFSNDSVKNVDLKNITNKSLLVDKKINSGQKSFDSLYRNSRRFKKASDQMNLYQYKVNRLKELDNLKNGYNIDSIKINFDGKVEDIKANNSKGFKKRLKKYGLYKPQYDLLLSIKKLDFGTFDPAYTTLILSGISLKGINTEINYGNLYGAFTYGSVSNNFNYRSFFSNTNSEQTILACRAGIGRIEKLLFAVSLLKGQDNGGNQLRDSNSGFLLPEKNYVLGIDIRYKFSDFIDLGVEYAKSTIQDRENNKGSDDASSIKNLISASKSKYSDAWTGYFNLKLKSNTKLHFMTRQIDPFYYSFGAPFLRKDNFRIEAKGEQHFWKKQFSAAITVRKDQDNIYDLKEATSRNLTSIYTFHLKIKKYPFLLVNYSPNYQSNFNALTKHTFSSSIIYYGLTSGYTFQTRSISVTSTLNFSRQFNKTTAAGYSLFDISQYMLSENLFFKQMDIMFSGILNYTFPAIGDTGRIYFSNLMVSKTSHDKKTTISIGYVYQKDFGVDRRNCIQTNVTLILGWGITSTLKLEKQFIKNYKVDKENSNLNIGRVIIMKTF